MYKLEFPNDPVGQARYEICFESLAIGTRPPQVTEFVDMVDLVESLRSIGVKKEGMELYELGEPGGILVMKRGPFNLLKTYVAQPVWRALSLEKVLKVKNWLEDLKEEQLNAST